MAGGKIRPVTPMLFAIGLNLRVHVELHRSTGQQGPGVQRKFLKLYYMLKHSKDQSAYIITENLNITIRVPNKSYGIKC